LGRRAIVIVCHNSISDEGAGRVGPCRSRGRSRSAARTFDGTGGGRKFRSVSSSRTISGFRPASGEDGLQLASLALRPWRASREEEALASGAPHTGPGPRRWRSIGGPSSSPVLRQVGSPTWARAGRFQATPPVSFPGVVSAPRTLKFRGGGDAVTLSNRPGRFVGDDVASQDTRPRDGRTARMRNSSSRRNFQKSGSGMFEPRPLMALGRGARPLACRRGGASRDGGG